MEVLENDLKELNLTILEKSALQSLITGLYAEPGFSDVGVEEIQNDLLIGNINIIKGVLGSLVKKEIVFVGEDDFEGIIYLHSNYYYLHPEWKED